MSPLIAGNATVGHIIVNGALEAGALITCTQAFDTPTSYITIDYDGWDPLDKFSGDATVSVGGVPYHGNAPDARVFATTRCRADLEGDEDVDFDDLAAFTVALTDPAGFAAAYPGRAGGMTFHGDLDCDKDIDFDDIAPFIVRLQTSCCWEECGPCPPGGDGFGPQELALGMLSHTHAQYHGWLRSAVAALVERESVPARRAYWQEVLGHLGP